jgi:hypothetical protein
VIYKGGSLGGDLEEQEPPYQESHSKRPWECSHDVEVQTHIFVIQDPKVVVKDTFVHQ